MKHVQIGCIAFFMFFTILDLKASSNDKQVNGTVQTTNIVDSEKNDAIQVRRLEIKNIDKTTLSHSQKKSLRQEVRVMNKEKVHGGGGIYLSLSAIVIVLLLLVILL